MVNRFERVAKTASSITQEGTDLSLESRTSSHLVRIQGTQNPAEVIQNAELIAVIANQQAADAMRKAADALAGGADAAAALQHFADAKLFLGCCAAPEFASEAAALLDEHEQQIRSRGAGLRARKDLLYEASALLRTDQQRQALYGLRQEIRVHQETNRRSTIEREISYRNIGIVRRAANKWLTG